MLLGLVGITAYDYEAINRPRRLPFGCVTGKPFLE
jgi:hypothetical protein